MTTVNPYYSRPFLVPRGVTASYGTQTTVLQYLRALTLTVWFGSLVANYWWRTDWFAMYDLMTTGFDIKEYYYYGFAVALIGHMTLGLGKWISAPFMALSTTPAKLLTLFCLLMLVLSPLSASPRTSSIYAVATWMVFLLCFLYWQSDFHVVRRVLILTGLLLFAWLFILLVHHGQPRGFGGQIGGINRNTTSTVALAAMAMCAFADSKKIRWGGFFAAIFLTVVVTSRGTLVAICVFLAVYYALRLGTTKAIRNAVLGMICVAAILLVSTFLQEFVFQDVLHLNDPSRGLGSGFTGRVEYWKNGVMLFWEEPLIGRGFRSGGDGLPIHSGYLKIFVEAGIFGGAVIIAAVFLEAIRRFRLALRYQRQQQDYVSGIDGEETSRINTISCATLCSTLTLWTYEPLYVNLGSSISVLFFLMMAAPSYISAESRLR